MARWTRAEIQEALDHYRETALQAGTSGDWGAWADLFTEDATGDWGSGTEGTRGRYEGKKDIVNFLDLAGKEAVMFRHMAIQPVIDIDGGIYNSPQGGFMSRGDNPVSMFISYITIITD